MLSDQQLATHLARPQGPLQPFVQLLRDAINSTGAALEACGDRTLGDHIVRVLDDLHTQG